MIVGGGGVSRGDCRAAVGVIAVEIMIVLIWFSDPEKSSKARSTPVKAAR